MTPETIPPPPPFDDLLPGITYSSESGLLVLLGPGFLPEVGNTSNVLGPYSSLDTLDLTLESASAIGFDVFPGVAESDVLISVFDSANALMGTFTISASPGGTFFGIVSDSGPIGRINVDNLAEFEGGLVDNVAFGVPVPEPATIIFLGTGLAGLVRTRYRRTHRMKAGQDLPARSPYSQS